MLKCLNIIVNFSAVVENWNMYVYCNIMLCCTSETVNLKVEEVKGLMLPFTLTSHWKKGFIQFRFKGRCKILKWQEVTCVVVEHSI